MASPLRVLLLLVLVQAIVPCLIGNNAVPTGQERTAEQIRQTLMDAEDLREAGKYDEGIDLTLEALDNSLILNDSRLAAQAHYQTAIFYNLKGSFDRARAHLELGLDLARSVDDAILEADLLVAEGIVEWKLGNLNLASHHLLEAMAIRERLEDAFGLANIANNLGIIQFSLKKHDQAIQYYERGIEWLGDQERDRLRSSLYSNLAESLIATGDYTRSEKYLQDALEIEERQDNAHYIAYIYLDLAKLRSLQERSADSIRLYNKALELQLASEETWTADLTRLSLAREHLKRDESDAALNVLAPGFESAKRLNALSLLRDYADLYREIYALRDEPGLKVYYEELRDWFDRRVRQPIDMPSNSLVRPSEQNADYFRLKSREAAFVWLRLAILCALALLILFLASENLRLRRKRNKSVLGPEAR